MQRNTKLLVKMCDVHVISELIQMATHDNILFLCCAQWTITAQNKRHVCPANSKCDMNTLAIHNTR